MSIEIGPNLADTLPGLIAAAALPIFALAVLALLAAVPFAIWLDSKK